MQHPNDTTSVANSDRAALMDERARLLAGLKRIDAALSPMSLFVGRVLRVPAGVTASLCGAREACDKRVLVGYDLDFQVVVPATEADVEDDPERVDRSRWTAAAAARLDAIEAAMLDGLEPLAPLRAECDPDAVDYGHVRGGLTVRIPLNEASDGR